MQSKFKENIENLAEELLNAKSFVKDKVVGNLGVRDIVDRVVASNLTLAFFTHLQNCDSKAECLGDVNDVFTKLLESVSRNRESKEKDVLPGD